MPRPVMMVRTILLLVIIYLLCSCASTPPPSTADTTPPSTADKFPRKPDDDSERKSGPAMLFLEAAEADADPNNVIVIPPEKTMPEPSE